MLTLRKGVKWHSGRGVHRRRREVHLGHDDQQDLRLAIPSGLRTVFGGKGAYKVTGTHEITVDLRQLHIEFLDTLMGAFAIMPEHAYKDIKPEELRGHVASTWLGSYTVKTSDGKSFTARGAIGTGPWIPMGFDPARKAYSFKRNEDYWKPHTGNVKTFYVVNIHGTDSVLSALKAGEIDAHDPMYDIGPLVSTIDPQWGKVQTFDSYKWQHICYNLKHPVFGTGRRDPARQERPVAGGGSRRLHSPGHQPRHAARADRQGNRRRLRQRPARCQWPGRRRNTTTIS